MMIYIEPVNIKQWNLFENVKQPGHIEPFLATQSMTIGDTVLLHVGQQDKRYESGVYAYGTIIKGPFILEDHPDDYCNGKNTVLVRIDQIDYTLPMITHDDCKEFCHQFRTVHVIEPCHYGKIEERIQGLLSQR